MVCQMCSRLASFQLEDLELDPYIYQPLDSNTCHRLSPSDRWSQSGIWISATVGEWDESNSTPIVFAQNTFYIINCVWVPLWDFRDDWGSWAWAMYSVEVYAPRRSVHHVLAHRLCRSMSNISCSWRCWYQYPQMVFPPITQKTNWCESNKESKQHHFVF